MVQNFAVRGAKRCALHEPATARERMARSMWRHFGEHMPIGAVQQPRHEV